MKYKPGDRVVVVGPDMEGDSLAGPSRGYITSKDRWVEGNVMVQLDAPGRFSDRQVWTISSFSESSLMSEKEYFIKQFKELYNKTTI